MGSMAQPSLNVLVLNCGSTSIKFQLLDTGARSSLVKGSVDRIGREDCAASVRSGGDPKRSESLPSCSHPDALAWVFGALPRELPVHAVGHRVVHGGSLFSSATPVNDRTLRGIESCIPLAPLHNPVQLAGIQECLALHPELPQFASFDTAFHLVKPELSSLVPLPQDMVRRLGYRKFGFHGASHRYVAQRAAALLGHDLSDLKLVTCHLGGGSSVTAVCGGVAVDTSAVYGTCTGMPMGTRSGDVDAGILLDLLTRQGMSAEEVSDLLYKRSGLAGISGVSGDMAELETLEARGHGGARLAREYYIYCLKKFIGAFAAAMDGLDGIVFTAGIGENDADLRARACAGLRWLGAHLDAENNRARGVEAIVSTPDSPVAILVVPTDEELAIALEVAEALGASPTNS